MKTRTLREFSKTLTVAMAICIFSYTGTASFGYLTFGSDVNQDVLESYDPSPDVLVAVIGLAGKMYTTYPILLFVGRSVSVDDRCPLITGFGGHRIPVVACWTSDHWVADSNPLKGMFHQ